MFAPSDFAPLSCRIRTDGLGNGAAVLLSRFDPAGNGVHNVLDHLLWRFAVRHAARELGNLGEPATPVRCTERTYVIR